MRFLVDNAVRCFFNFRIVAKNLWGGARRFIPAVMPCAALLVIGLAPMLIKTAAAQSQAASQSATNNIVRERERWFYGQREYPLGHIPAGARWKALQQLRNRLHDIKTVQASIAGGSAPSAQSANLLNAIALSQTNWTLIGPQPVLSGGDLFSGRTTALVFDPRDPTNKTIYLGAAEGGLWSTTDGGQTWTPLTDSQPSLAVGSIALDPTTDPTTIYIGTGEENFNGDAYFGVGVLKSTDGGKTWTRDTTFTSPGPNGGPMIGALAVDPRNNQTLLAAVETTSSSLAGGIWRSTDGGNSWTLVSAPDDATDVVFDPSSPGVAYGALGFPNKNANNGVYKSTDDGATWSLVPIPGVAQTDYGRITLSMGPPSSSGKPGELLVASADVQSINLLGLYLTTDGGVTWAQLSGMPNFCAGQCFYDMAVGIDPQNPAVFYVGGTVDYPGGVVLVASIDGGKTWSPDLSGGNSGGSSSPAGYLHTDTHAIVFSPDGTVLATGNDGGVWSTTNVAVTSNITWNNLNNSLAITQFYPGIAIVPGNANEGIGGTQDNGTEAYSGSLGWQWILCGDGGFNAISPTDLTEYAACAALQGIWVNNGSGWVWGANGIGTCTRVPSSCYESLFVPPLAMDPEDSSVLYFSAQDQNGNWAMYQTIDGATSWQEIFSSLYPPGPAQAIAVAPTSSDVVYAAPFYAIWKTTNATAGAASVWEEVDTGLPHRIVTDVVLDPRSSTTAYVAFSGFSSCSVCDGMGHIYETTDGGTSWTNISGDLPDTPVNALVVDPLLTNTIYAATDIGVFGTTNGGSSWTPLVSGLPNVAVLGLTLDPGTRTLWAGTHGRSMWALQLPQAPTAELSPTTLTFSSQDVGTSSSPQAVTLTNNGGLALGITSITIDAGFTETNNCGSSLARGSSCSFDVTFAPNAAGSITGTLSIADGLPSSPQTVALSGTGVAVAGVILSPQTMSFSNQDVGGTSSSQPVTLTNAGTAQLNISSITLSGPFSQTNNCGSSVQVNASCTINISFAPAAAGSVSGTLTVTDDDASSPQTVALSGTGVTVPAVTLTPSSAAFSNTLVGTASAITNIQLTNSGSGTLNVSSISLTGTDSSQFALVAPSSGSPSCSLAAESLNAGTSCFFGVKFQPTSAGSKTASVSVTDNTTNSPQTVALSGSGLDFSISASPTSDSISPGAAASYTISVDALGGVSLSSAVSLSCKGLPALATCTFSPTTISPGAGSATSELTINTTASSLLSPFPTRVSPFLYPALCVGLMLVWVSCLPLRKRGEKRIRFAIASCAFLLLLVTPMISCSSNGGTSAPANNGTNGGTPAGTYSVVVTGTSGQLQRQVTVDLTVQ
jgi:photosystem II stability/assembly factor-like uncharacterized protein